MLKRKFARAPPMIVMLERATASVVVNPTRGEARGMPWMSECDHDLGRGGRGGGSW